MRSRKKCGGYTLVELLVTIVVIALLTATLGVLLVRLLTLQEHEREEAYVREKLADICGAYADFLSIGSYLSVSNRSIVVKYRQETGGVSLETGLVSRVVSLKSSLDATNQILKLDVDSFNVTDGCLQNRFLRKMNGDALLLPLAGEVVSCTITPLNADVSEDGDQQVSDAVLAYLEVEARFAVRNEARAIVTNTATAGRVVRLWNRE